MVHFWERDSLGWSGGMPPPRQKFEICRRHHFQGLREHLQAWTRRKGAWPNPSTLNPPDPPQGLLSTVHTFSHNHEVMRYSSHLEKSLIWKRPQKVIFPVHLEKSSLISTQWTLEQSKLLHWWDVEMVNTSKPPLSCLNVLPTLIKQSSVENVFGHQTQKFFFLWTFHSASQLVMPFRDSLRHCVRFSFCQTSYKIMLCVISNPDRLTSTAFKSSTWRRDVGYCSTLCEVGFRQELACKSC